MIQFVDLRAQQKEISPRVEERLKAVFVHGKYIMGPEVDELEEALADFAKVGYAVTCSSGTDALLMALLSLGTGPGDVILTTPFTFIATAEVIALLGAIPFFVDIDPSTFNLDPERLDLALRAIREKNPEIHPFPRLRRDLSVHRTWSPKGIVSVDLFGLPADYGKLNQIAEKHGLFLMADAAQSFGATCGGRSVGTLADVTATSFFPAKPLGCYGDGGAIFTNDENLAGVLKSIRLHGKGTEKYDNVRIGINGRLDTIQAAILLEKLRIFPAEIERRNQIAAKYSSGMQRCLQVPFVPPGFKSVWAQYSVLTDNRDLVQSALKDAGIPTMIYYPKPLHIQGAFKYLGYKPGDFPVSEETSRKILSLPMHPYLRDDEIDHIVKVVNEHFAGHTGAHLAEIQPMSA